jgi:hypothetical protein
MAAKSPFKPGWMAKGGASLAALLLLSRWRRMLALTWTIMVYVVRQKIA